MNRQLATPLPHPPRMRGGVLAAVSLAAIAAAPPKGMAAAAQPAPQPLQSAQPAERYRRAGAQLIEAALASEEAWGKITHLCDRIGPRLSGSKALEEAVDWAAREMAGDGLENVRRQPVSVPHWVRGEERASLISPRRAELAMLGLGRSVGTPPGGITAEVVVVGDFETLRALPEGEVRGRIVLYDVPFTTYGETVRYRWLGAREAAAKGALAALVRTVGRRSLGNPHTGAMAPYEEDAPRIPAAALSIEDARMIARLAASGEKVRVRLEMGARTLPEAPSHNVIGEIVGRELPREVVVIGAHLDSWDVGQGAHDDGAGCVVAMEAARLLQALGLRPRRTVRVVLWTNEENGGRGAEAYREAFLGGTERHVAAIEADGGAEDPWGFGASVWKSGSEEEDGTRQERFVGFLRRVAPLLSEIGADSVRTGGGGADISPLMREGVPGVALRTRMEIYWDIHHSRADTVDKIDPLALRRNVAAMAVMAYVLAETPEGWE